MLVTVTMIAEEGTFSSLTVKVTTAGVGSPMTLEKGSSLLTLGGGLLVEPALNVVPSGKFVLTFTSS